MRPISMLGALWFAVIMKCTGVDLASKCLPLMLMGRGCFSRARTSAWSMAAEKVRSLHSPRTSMRALVKEYRPGSARDGVPAGRRDSLGDALPVGKRGARGAGTAVEEISVSDTDRSSSVWMADHLVERGGESAEKASVCGPVCPSAY